MSDPQDPYDEAADRIAAAFEGERRAQGPSTSRSRLLSGLARRLRDPRELGEDALELVGAVLESSDRAKTEAVRMVAREVRTYLEELKLKDDLRALITGHSLEVHLSLSLKPLADAGGGDEEEASEEVAPPKPKGKGRARQGAEDAE